MLAIEDQRGGGSRKRPRDSRYYLWLGAVGSFVFVGASLAWATGAPLDGAVIASGNIAVESNLSRIQHPTGGVVGTILVKEGQRVTRGDVLIRLDETATRANLAIVLNDLNALTARRARLAAERDSATELKPSRELLDRAAADTEFRIALDSERSLFTARRRAREGQREQYTEQVRQLEQEIVGLQAQLASSIEQTTVAESELSDVRGLYARNLVQRTRVSQLEREVSRIKGMIGELNARIAQSRGKISETRVQMLQIDRTLESEVGRELRDVEVKIAEATEKRVTAEDQLRRIDLRAPSTGVVHQLQVHTVGGVIAPGAIVMSLVPENDGLVVEARVNPIDIDQLYPDQPARVRLHAFNSRTTPELNGSLLRIGADIVRDEKTNAAYYTVAVRIPDEERARLGALRLQAGMPADVFIRTTERTVVSFLMRPIFDHMNRAFRER